MFISKRRPIAIPQFEHQKLAGTLALLWGNDDFDRPPIAFDSFVKGVGLHDRAYGPLDNLPIGGVSEEVWLQTTQRGFAQSWDDPAAEAIAKCHLHRLTTYGRAPARQAAAAEMAQAVGAHLRQYTLDHQTFARIDRITQLCDNIAFDFCFEALDEGTVGVYRRWDTDEEVELHYRIDGPAITVVPWPFAVPSHRGYLVAYELEGYPDRLEPVVLPYELQMG
jgi:hypothetical protein